MTPLDPEEPCWCGSRQQYKRCHRPIDSVPTEQRLLAARGLYAKQWGRSASHLEGQNCYDWMASQLKPFYPKRILDIGCGVGNGLAAILKIFRNVKIISLDENPQAIAEAKLRLESEGAQVNTIQRLRDQPTSERSHSLVMERGKLRFTEGIDLVESDFLEDNELDEVLRNKKRFDAITVWLIGSHLLRYHECDSLRGKIDSPDSYRWNVQAVAFALAAQFLRPGGVLHLVDRGPSPLSTSMKEALLKMPMRMAQEVDGLLEFHALDYLAYKLPVIENGISLMNSSGEIVKPDQLAVISMMFTRRSR